MNVFPSYSSDYALHYRVRDKLVVPMDRSRAFSACMPRADISHIGFAQLRKVLSFPIGVVRRVRVSSLGKHIQGIISVISQEEMIGVDAGRVIALVEDAQTFRNRAVVEFPREPMGRDDQSRFGSYHDGPVRSLATLLHRCPNPAGAKVRTDGRSVLVDMLPKSVNWIAAQLVAQGNSFARATTVMNRPGSYAGWECVERLAADFAGAVGGSMGMHAESTSVCRSGAAATAPGFSMPNYTRAVSYY